MDGKMYWYHDGKEHKGAFSIEQLKAFGLTSNTPVWTNGMEKWMRARDVEELSILFTPPPAPKPSPSPAPTQKPTEQKTHSTLSNPHTIIQAERRSSAIRDFEIMKISIKYNSQMYVIMPDILRVLEVKAFNVGSSINLFNLGVESLARDIEKIEDTPISKLREYAIKFDLSNEKIGFELDNESWNDYKKYLGGIEGKKSISKKREEDLLSRGNITIVKSDNFFTKILLGEVATEQRLSGDILRPDMESADPNSPFYGKKVVFTGVLDSISREEAAGIIKKMGADIDTGISRNTDFVIVGAGAGPSKLKKIKEYNDMGANITIIYEDEFVKKINAWT